MVTLIQVLLNLSGAAYACFCRMVVISTGAWVHGCNQHQIGRIADSTFDAGNSDLAVFQWLTQHFQHSSVEFRQFAILKILAPL